MANVAHPILPSLQNIKLAMDSILKTAQDVIDVSPYLDAAGRLPFTSILPMLQALPETSGVSLHSIYKAMSRGTGTSIVSSEITEIADYAELSVGSSSMNVSIPNCKRLGTRAFYSSWMETDTKSFESIEEIGEIAFGNCIFTSYPTFPKIATVGPKAFYAAQGDITLPSATSIADDAFTALTVEGSVGYTILGIRTLRLPNLAKDTVLAMPGYPFGMIQYRWRAGSGYPGGIEMWETTERRIICANREIIVPDQTETLKRSWE